MFTWIYHEVQAIGQRERYHITLSKARLSHLIPHFGELTLMKKRYKIISFSFQESTNCHSFTSYLETSSETLRSNLVKVFREEKYFQNIAIAPFFIRETFLSLCELFHNLFRGTRIKFRRIFLERENISRLKHS